MGDALVWMGGVRDRLATSLFLLPSAAVLAAVALGALTLALDGRIEHRADLPLVLDSTVESSRTVLQVVAGATIAFAGVAFSISMLTVQQASAQYSPRVIEAIFRDPFNRRVMALVVGTFTFSLTVLRSVRSPISDGGEAVVPLLSVTIAVVLGVVTILGVVGFIDHNARAMDISTILDRIDRSTIAQFDASWRDPDDTDGGEPEAPFPTTTHVVRAVDGGWVQRFDVDALLDALAPGTAMTVHVHPGRFVIAGAPVASLSAVPDDEQATADHIRHAITLGPSRSREQDVTLGLRQFADIALRALSPGVNDPTTARDAILHASNVLSVALRREPPASRHRGSDGRQLLLDGQPDHEALVELAFSEVGRAAAAHPAVSMRMFEAFAELHGALLTDGHPDQATLLARSARALLADSDAADLSPQDHRAVRACFESHVAWVHGDRP